MSKSKEYDQTHPLPPLEFGGTPLSPAVAIEEYNVGSWCPTPDGSGKPTAVMLRLKIRLDALTPLTVAMRFKTAGELRRFIGALSRHLADVWPEAME